MTTGRKSIPLVNRFWRMVDTRGQDDCWPWSGYKNEKGYGQVSGEGGKVTRYAHIVAYELTVGPVPTGLVLDHTCRNPSCCNPRHLDPVTNRTNTLRGTGFAAVNAIKTHCVKGHPLSGDNLRILTRKGHPVGRRCLICHRERERRRYQKRKAA